MVRIDRGAALLMLAGAIALAIAGAWTSMLYYLALALVWAISSLVRAQAWRSGYYDGRFGVFSSMYEAARRGWPLEQWLRSEAERDGIRLRKE
jgi:ABC-type sugar transport system permease subunit